MSLRRSVENTPVRRWRSDGSDPQGASAAGASARTCERTPATIAPECADLEATFQREAAIRKAQSVANVPKWDAIRGARPRQVSMTVVGHSESRRC